MAVSIKELLRGLQGLNPVVVHISNPAAVISSFQFMEGDNPGFREDVLHIGSPVHLQGVANLRGANLLLLPGGNSLPEAIDFSGANIIVICGHYRIETLFNALQGTISSSYDVANHALALLHSMLQGRGLIDIIEMGARILNRLVFLTDSSFKILARSLSKPSDEMELTYFLELGYLPWQIIDALRTHGILDRLADESKPILINSWVNPDKKRIIGKVEADGKLLAYVIVLGHDRTFAEQDTELVALMCKMIAAEMRKRSYHGDNQSLMHENLLLDLLEDCIDREEVALERARTANFQIARGYRVLCMDIDRSQVNPQLIDYLRQDIEARISGAKTLAYRKHLLVLLAIRSGQTREEELQAHYRDFLDRHHLNAGISLPFSGLLPLREHYLQAVRALELSEIFNTRDSLCFYENYKTYDLLSAVSERKNLMSFCHPAIALLQQYDPKGQLLESLWSFLDCHQNLVATARQLAIHRNTLVYRLSRIKDLTDLDLEDAETVFQLQFSHRILNFVTMLTAESE